MKNFIGIPNIIHEIKIVAGHAKPFPHILFVGPRGCGKTQLSKYVGELTGQRFNEINAPSLSKEKIYATLISTEPNDIIFIDEIHRLTPVVEEILYQPLESCQLTLPFKNRLQTVDFVPFTLIGATTNPSLMSKPLISRFKMQLHIPKYTKEDLALIITETTGLVKPDAELVSQYVLVPREAINLAGRIKALGMTIPKGLEFLGFKFGLSEVERSYLKYLEGGQVSITTMSAYLQLDENTIGYIEERLFDLQLIEITGRGRCLTYSGIQKLREIK